ncbi:hypothetical protein GCM10010129_19510 [Streptomyces fumigatiscleroticus]|nr:hypothetical protein GCM10010129_19510 [Streptomyces fumigatiscleroticus]
MHRHPHLPGRVALPETPRPPDRAPLPEQSGGTPPATPLECLNRAAAADARRLLLACLRSHRWARRIADHRPYPDLDALLAAADEAAYDLTPADLAEALAAESLPALPEDTYSVAHTALSAAHAAYEARFGHVFVICLDQAAPEEALDHVLAGIRSRLANDPEEERMIAAEELRRLARGRLAGALAGTGERPTGHDGDTPGR